VEFRRKPAIYLAKRLNRHERVSSVKNDVLFLITIAVIVKAIVNVMTKIELRAYFAEYY